MKQLILNLKSMVNGLGNLSEKDAMEYEDVVVNNLSDSERVKEFYDIAEALAEMVCAHKFDEDDDDDTHPFLSCSKELAQTIGIDKITVCPYKGQIHNPWVDSNYMWHKQDDGYSSLIIDVYSTQDAFKDFVCEDILQELYNFKHDAKCVIDGVYEEEEIWKSAIENWRFMASPHYWGELKKGTKFEENGHVGLRLEAPDTNTTFFPAQYDEIEVHPDHVWVRLSNNERSFYPDEGENDGYGRGPHVFSDVFSENGKRGLKDDNGRVILPARYDVVHEWGYGDGADVIYVREGSEYHYYNHAGEEILKGMKPMMGYPYFLVELVEENPNGEMLCIEPIERPETERDCYAYGRWVRLNSIPCDAIRDIFQKCEIVPVCEDTYANFCNEWTYYYSAIKTRAKGEDAIMRCVQTIASFNVHMLKISVNHNTQIDPHDLYNAVFYNKNEQRTRETVISIGYDDTLEDGEVSVLRVHSYNCDISPMNTEDTYLADTLSKGTYEEVVEGWDKYEDKAYLTKNAFLLLGMDFERSWETTCRVADFIYSKAVGNIDDYMQRATELDWWQTNSPESLAHKLKAMEWALRHGADVNKVSDGSYLSRAIDCKTEIDGILGDEDETERFLLYNWNDRKIALLKAHGALMPEEILEMNQKRVEGLTLSEIVAL